MIAFMKFSLLCQTYPSRQSNTVYQTHTGTGDNVGNKTVTTYQTNTWGD
jgi:hypothetical protein